MRALAPWAAALVVLPLAGCGGGGSADDGRTTLTVFAAASLTTTFEQLADDFEAQHPDVDVQLSFGGSSDLVAQLTEGAEADVFASADTRNMDALVDAGLAADEPSEFATNTLMIAVPPGNPAGVEGLADLGDEDLDVVVCAPEVPCGNASLEVAEAAGVTLAPDSEEQSVTDVLGKVEAGEADAGLVYLTDVTAADEKVEGIAFPEAAGVVNHYPVVVVDGAPHASLAREWVDLLLGDGRAVLAEAGFGPAGP
ncbi:MAG TPA: molybdate ABC transporter substrate-binding protein [Nocardioides sp.]|nr:molybdate ABC transporter substrate-binding protein [Nocardioides sp.]